MEAYKESIRNQIQESLSDILECYVDCMGDETLIKEKIANLEELERLIKEEGSEKISQALIEYNRSVVFLEDHKCRLCYEQGAKDAIKMVIGSLM